MSDPRTNNDASGDPEPTGDEELVAYLDGQLPAEECERVESRLAADESTRLRVQELDGVWDALDALPRTTTSASFTQTTIDMAAVGASAGAPRPRRRTPWLGLTVAAASLACGVLAGLVLAGTPARRELQTLPTALHAETLENAGSVEFLVGLLDRWPESLATRLADEVRSEEGVWETLAAAEWRERRAWLEDLPPGRVDEVGRRVEVFRDASPARREALVRLDRQIAEHPRREELRVAALGYDALIATLSPGEHARLRGLGVEERLDEVAKKARDWSNRLALRLDEGERDALNGAIDALVEDERFADLLRRAPGGPTARQFFWGTTRAVASGRLPRDPQPLPPRRRDEPKGRPDGMRQRLDNLARGLSEIAAAWPDWAERLETVLPDEARERIAAAKSPAKRARRWMQLLGSAAPEDLADAFAALPNDRMEEVLLLPREELTETLDAPPDPFRGVGRARGQRGFLPGFGPPPGPPGPPPHERRPRPR